MIKALHNRKVVVKQVMIRSRFGHDESVVLHFVYSGCYDQHMVSHLFVFMFNFCAFISLKLINKVRLVISKLVHIYSSLIKKLSCNDETLFPVVPDLTHTARASQVSKWPSSQMVYTVY